MALVSSPAKALVQEFKSPRPFLVRLSVGVGRAIRDAHRSINIFLWDELDTNSEATPTGFILAVPVSIGTGILTIMGCGLLSLITGLTGAQMLMPAIIIGLLPAELVACNILINTILALPKIAIGIVKGIFNGTRDLCKFIKEQVEMRIPDE